MIKLKVTGTEISSQVETRDNRSVRIYAIDGSPPYTIHGAIKLSAPDSWRLACWYPNGRMSRFKKETKDLVLIKEKYTLYANIYNDGEIYTHRTPEKAKASTAGFACRYIALPVTISVPPEPGILEEDTFNQA